MAKLAFCFLLAICITAFVATFNAVNMLLVRSSASYGESMADDDADTRTTIDLQARRLGGAVVQRPVEDKKAKKKRMFHTAVTANDNPYSKWQCRIMYHWYKKYAAMEGSEMGGYTRILHTGQPDNLMEEIPTWVAQPLPAGMDQGYVVLNRPSAFAQWVEQVEIEEEYVFMAEPDHIIVKPIPNLATEFMPSAFPFFYITPPENEALLRQWFPKGPITDIDPIRNSPVIIKKSDLARIAPLWHNVSLQMKENPKTDKEFGWVLEMYGYATASAMLGYHHILRKEFMIQPPYDTTIGDAYIIHYTYGCDYTMKGEPMFGKFGEWRFDKRSYSGGAPPKNLTMPPKGVPESVVTLISRINDATYVLPDWKEGAI